MGICVSSAPHKNKNFLKFCLNSSLAITLILSLIQPSSSWKPIAQSYNENCDFSSRLTRLGALYQGYALNYTDLYEKYDSWYQGKAISTPSYQKYPCFNPLMSSYKHDVDTYFILQQSLDKVGNFYFCDYSYMNAMLSKRSISLPSNYVNDLSCTNYFCNSFNPADYGTNVVHPIEQLGLNEGARSQYLVFHVNMVNYCFYCKRAAYLNTNSISPLTGEPQYVFDDYYEFHELLNAGKCPGFPSPSRFEPSYCDSAVKSKREAMIKSTGTQVSIQNINLQSDPRSCKTFLNPVAAVYYDRITHGSMYQAFMCTCANMFGDFGLFAYSCDVYYYSLMFIVGLFFPCCFCCCGCCYICAFCVFVCIPNTFCQLCFCCSSSKGKKKPQISNSSKLKKFLKNFWEKFVANPQYHANFYILFSVICLMLVCGLDLNFSVLDKLYQLQVFLQWLCYIGLFLAYANIVVLWSNIATRSRKFKNMNFRSLDLLHLLALFAVYVLAVLFFFVAIFVQVADFVETFILSLGSFYAQKFANSVKVFTCSVFSLVFFFGFLFYSCRLYQTMNNKTSSKKARRFLSFKFTRYMILTNFIFVCFCLCWAIKLVREIDGTWVSYPIAVYIDDIENLFAFLLLICLFYLNLDRKYCLRCFCLEGICNFVEKKCNQICCCCFVKKSKKNAMNDEIESIKLQKMRQQQQQLGENFPIENFYNSQVSGPMTVNLLDEVIEKEEEEEALKEQQENSIMNGFAAQAAGFIVTQDTAQLRPEVVSPATMETSYTSITPTSPIQDMEEAVGVNVNTNSNIAGATIATKTEETQLDQLEEDMDKMLDELTSAD